MSFVLALAVISQGRAAFKDLAKASNSFSPSSGDFASPKSLTIALPTMTPSAPHPATYKITELVNLRAIESRMVRMADSIFRQLTCFTCSGLDMPKPTATGLLVACK